MLEKLRTVADSSTETEYNIAMSEAAKEGIFFKKLLTEIGNNIGYINLISENQSALTLAVHSTLHQRAKHIDINRNLIRYWIASKVIKLNYVNTNINIADILTKSVQSTITIEI